MTARPSGRADLDDTTPSRALLPDTSAEIAPALPENEVLGGLERGGLERRSDKLASDSLLLRGLAGFEDPDLSADAIVKLVAQDLERIHQDRGADIQKISKTVSDIVQAVTDHSDGTRDAHGGGKAEVYSDRDGEWVGVQYSGGYVMVRRKGASTLMDGPKAAIARLLARRSLISHPPMIPNSSSRLLIWLIIICIVVMGLITVFLQEMWSRWRASASHRKQRQKRRRRSSETPSSDQRPVGRSPLHRQVSASMLTQRGSGDDARLFDDEEVLITTPPAMSRRPSARSIHTQPDPEAYEDDKDKTPQPSPELHYFALPLGFGIGYSYVPISDENATKAKLDQLAAASARERRSESGLSHKRSPSEQLSSLPITGGKALRADAGTSLRSRAKTLKDMCSSALAATAATPMAVTALTATTSAPTSESSCASSVSDEADGVSPTTPSSLPFWGAGMDNDDLTPLASQSCPTDYWASTPMHDARCSNPLGEVKGLSLKGKARASRGGSPEPLSLVDLSSADLEPSRGVRAYAVPELVVTDGQSSHGAWASEEDGSGSSVSSSPPGSASAVARHPLVEHLRREGRIDGGRRIGNGTPTTARPLSSNGL